MSTNKSSIHWPILVLGIIVAALFLTVLFVFKVDQTDYAIMERFGSPIKSQDGESSQVRIYKPGLHFKLPFIDQVWRHDKRWQDYKLKRGRVEQMQTADGYQLIASTYVIWKVGDVYKFYKTVGTTENARDKLDEIVRNSRNSTIGQHSLNEFINVDSKKLDLNGIEDEILKSTAKVADNEYGISIRYIGFRHLGFPQDVSRKVFERMQTERKAQAQEYRSEGEKKAAQIKAEADLEARKIIADAKAEATGIRAEGDQSAAQFYSVFQKNPQLAAFLRKLEALRNTLSDKTTLIFDTNTVPYDLFLPGATDLEKLQKQIEQIKPSEKMPKDNDKDTENNKAE